MSITFVARTVLPTEWGTFDIFGFENDETGKEHLALALGDLKSNSDPITVSYTHLTLPTNREV